MRDAIDDAVLHAIGHHVSFPICLRIRFYDFFILQMWWPVRGWITNPTRIPTQNHLRNTANTKLSPMQLTTTRHTTHIWLP